MNIVFLSSRKMTGCVTCTRPLTHTESETNARPSPEEEKRHLVESDDYVLLVPKANTTHRQAQTRASDRVAQSTRIHLTLVGARTSEWTCERCMKELGTRFEQEMTLTRETKKLMASGLSKLTSRSSASASLAFSSNDRVSDEEESAPQTLLLLQQELDHIEQEREGIQNEMKLLQEHEEHLKSIDRQYVAYSDIQIVNCSTVPP